VAIFSGFCHRGISISAVGGDEGGRSQVSLLHYIAVGRGKGMEKKRGKGRNGQAFKTSFLKLLHPQFQGKGQSWECWTLSCCLALELWPPKLKGDFLPLSGESRKEARPGQICRVLAPWYLRGTCPDSLTS
jgi:hypothetical protein